ncbi:peroxiredoxin [uncultured Sulfitobacter sp.]|uniref:peroxiredoxin n=1 Tax=uncultured Sulfitobacter sp. TaxID=191468 RepID=UPI002594D123|nr:peroxiredoxin [uncultured Sulfitobacter sp.]
METNIIPETVFHTRVRNESLGGSNPFEWKDLTTKEVFSNRKVVVFAVPGAFTPACSDDHLPAYEAHYAEFQNLGVDEIYCVAVNDAFVLRQWALSRAIEKVQMLPDGNGDFSRSIGMLVDRTAQGLGMRSWRYSMFVDDGKIEKFFVEPNMRDNPPGVPVSCSDAQNMLEYLKTARPA